MHRLEHLPLAAELAALHGSRADALAAKEQYLTHSADPRATRLLALADERGRLTAELDELRRASRDADAAERALAEVSDRLGTAANWSTFDTYFDHGMIANAVKYDRLDLAELGGSEPTPPRLEISPGFKFADIFFNNIFTDLAVGGQISDAQDNVGRSVDRSTRCGTGLRRKSTRPPGGSTRWRRSGSNCSRNFELDQPVIMPNIAEAIRALRPATRLLLT